MRSPQGAHRRHPSPARCISTREMGDTILRELEKAA
jgi:hypothetical protein